MKWRHLCPWASQSVQHSFTEICRHRGPGADGKVKWCQLSISFNADSTSALAVSVTLFASSASSSMESGNIRVLDRLLLEFGVMPILPTAQQERIDVKSPHSIFFQQTKPCLAALQFGKHVAWSKTAGLEIYCPFSWDWYVILVSAGFVIFSSTVYHTYSQAQYITHFLHWSTIGISIHLVIDLCVVIPGSN